MLQRLLSLVKTPINGHLEAQYLEMHRRGEFGGQTWKSHFQVLQSLIPNLEDLRIVDFGCGPLGGLQQFLPTAVIPYDPFVEQYSEPPWTTPFDVLFSSDVLEHVPVREIHSLLVTIRNCSPRLCSSMFRRGRRLSRFQTGRMRNHCQAGTLVVKHRATRPWPRIHTDPCAERPSQIGSDYLL